MAANSASATDVVTRDRVRSSVIDSVAYDSHLSILEVEFLTGRVYQYFMVPERAYRELLEAESIGDYFNREIRPRYRCVEVPA